MLEVELTSVTLWPPEVPQTALTLNDFGSQYLRNDDR